MRPAGSIHDPAPDRLLAVVAAPVARGLAAFLPAAGFSLVSLLLAGGAFLALLSGAHLVAALLILLAALTDAGGGSVGRARSFGAVLDGVADRYADTLILAGMAAWSYRHEEHPAPLAVGFVALMGAVALGYAGARVQASTGQRAGRFFAWTGRDARLLVAAAGAALGQAYWSLVLLALLANLPVAWMLVRLRGVLAERSEAVD